MAVRPVFRSYDCAKGGKTKNLERSIFIGFLDISFFSYKFCAQAIRMLILYYNFIFNLHEFTLPLRLSPNFATVISYSAVFVYRPSSVFRLFLTSYMKT